MIYSRAQWGADERMRDQSLAALRRGARRLRAPHGQRQRLHRAPRCRRILRGIYAYHTQSRGWTRHRLQLPRRPLRPDLGGPVRRRRPPRRRRAHPRLQRRLLRHVGDRQLRHRPARRRRWSTPTARLFAWKLSPARRPRRVHPPVGRPSATSRRSTATATSAQTACPGRYLYAKIPTIRTLAAHYQRSFAGRARLTNLVGIAKPDLVVRDRRTKQAFLVRSDRTGHLGRVTAHRHLPAHADRVLNAGDWNGDGHGDVVTRSGRTGLLFLYRGTGTGRFAGAGADEPEELRARCGCSPPSATYTGDGRPDLLGQPARRLDADLPRQRRHRLPGQLRRARALTAGQQLGVGPVERRRRPRTRWCAAATARWCSTRATAPAGSPAAAASARLGAGLRLAASPPATSPATGRPDLVVRARVHRPAVAAARARRGGFGSRRVSAPATCGASTSPAEQPGRLAELPGDPLLVGPRRPRRPRRGAAPRPRRRRATSGASSVASPRAGARVRRR